MKRQTIALAVNLMLLVPSLSARVHAGESFCAEPQTGKVPARPTTASSGSELGRRLGEIDDDAREDLIRTELLSGNIPEFLRRLRPVEIRSAAPGGERTRITVCVMPDYLALGSDRDYLLVPMRLQTALTVASRYGFSLPTPAIVDAIHAQSDIHLTPQPLPASAAMRSTAYYLNHDALVRSQRDELDATPGMLISGDKKDLVLTNRLWRNLERVAIYGWHARDGRPIQPLSTVHGWHYVDYSHGVRLVAAGILVNGEPQDLLRALRDRMTARLLSDDGIALAASDLVDRLAEAHGPRVSASAR